MHREVKSNLGDGILFFLTDFSNSSSVGGILAVQTDTMSIGMELTVYTMISCA